MQRVVFIVPPNITYADFVNPSDNVKAMHRSSGTFGAVITDVPLGVLSLSAYAKKRPGIQTQLLDFNVVLNRLNGFPYGSFPEFFSAYLSEAFRQDPPPDVIGITALFTPSYQNTLDIARCCRAAFPDAVIVAGGGVATNMFSQIFRDSTSFDALCYGEGEKPLLALLQASNSHDLLQEHPSWITPSKVAAGASFQHDAVEFLDEIPPYDYEILDKDGYALSPTISAYTSIKDAQSDLPLMTSRGCTHHCCFCASHTVHGRKMRYHSTSVFAKT